MATWMAATSLSAQQLLPAPNHQLGINLQKIVQRSLSPHHRAKVAGQAPTAADSVNVVVQLVPTAGITASQIEALGGRIDWMMKSAASVRMPISQIGALAALPGVRNIDTPKMLRTMNENSRKVLHVNEAQDETLALDAGLPRPFKGKNILLGVIDTGIDPGHVNFRDDDGNCRIKMYLDYQGYDPSDMHDYYTPEEISHLVPNTTESHGTHVMGSAGGSYAEFRGMAPEADLAAANLYYLSDANIADALRRLAAYAEEHEQPMVVNMSFGSPEGFHDGCATVSTIADELTHNGDKPGLIMMMSAGNSGDNNSSINHSFTARTPRVRMQVPTLDTQVSFEAGSSTIYTSPMSQNAYVSIYSSNDADIDLSIAAFDKQTQQRLDADEYCAVAKLYYLYYEGEEYYLLKPYPGAEEVGYQLVTATEIQEYAEVLDQLSYQEHNCVDGTTHKRMYYWDLADTEIYLMDDYALTLEASCLNAGTQVVAYYIQDGIDKSFGTDQLPGVATPNPNNNFNNEACTESIISVGALCKSNAFSNYQGHTWQYPSIPTDRVADFSSFGYNKPEILAPGVCILSSTNNHNEYNFQPDGSPTAETDADQYTTLYGYTDVDGQKHWWEYMMGTSMASPIAAGVVALWMEACPRLTTAQLREVLANSCLPYTDTSVPAQRRSRYGLLDALEGLRHIATSITGIDYLDEGNIAAPAASARAYNLLGQPVAAPTHRGLYIVGGRKVIR